MHLGPQYFPLFLLQGLDCMFIAQCVPKSHLRTLAGCLSPRMPADRRSGGRRSDIPHQPVQLGEIGPEHPVGERGSA